MRQIYDALRKEWVAATPEEIVRQGLIHRMITSLGYSPHLIVVEKNLSDLATSQKGCPPLRRVDLLVFGEREHTLFPLLVIECKKGSSISFAMRQVIGYNDYIEAPFIGVTDETGTLIGSYNKEEGEYQFQPGLPSYDLLMKGCY